MGKVPGVSKIEEMWSVLCTALLPDGWRMGRGGRVLLRKGGRELLAKMLSRGQWIVRNSHSIPTLDQLNSNLPFNKVHGWFGQQRPLERSGHRVQCSGRELQGEEFEFGLSLWFHWKWNDLGAGSVRFLVEDPSKSCCANVQVVSSDMTAY
jgi:hypothetical protein